MQRSQFNPYTGGPDQNFTSQRQSTQLNSFASNRTSTSVASIQRLRNSSSLETIDMTTEQVFYVQMGGPRIVYVGPGSGPRIFYIDCDADPEARDVDAAKHISTPCHFAYRDSGRLNFAHDMENGILSIELDLIWQGIGTFTAYFGCEGVRVNSEETLTISKYATREQLNLKSPQLRTVDPKIQSCCKGSVKLLCNNVTQADVELWISKHKMDSTAWPMVLQVSTGGHSQYALCSLRVAHSTESVVPVVFSLSHEQPDVNHVHYTYSHTTSTHDSSLVQLPNSADTTESTFSATYLASYEVEPTRLVHCVYEGDQSGVYVLEELYGVDTSASIPSETLEGYTSLSGNCSDLVTNHLGTVTSSLNIPHDTSSRAINIPVSSDDAMCVVCLTAAKDTTFLPCRHLCVCEDCAFAVKTSSNRCPICRTAISKTLRL